MKTVECPNCEKAVTMCKRIPGLGTVKQTKKIISLGHSAKLTLRTLNGVPLLGPGHGEFTGKDVRGKVFMTPDYPCALLKDNKCSVYEHRPHECKTACCKDQHSGYQSPEPFLRSWRKPAGKALIDAWLKQRSVECSG